MKPEDFNFEYDPQIDRYYTEVQHSAGTFKCSVWIHSHEPNRLVVSFEPVDGKPIQFAAELHIDEVNYDQMASLWAANILEAIEQGRL